MLLICIHSSKYTASMLHHCIYMVTIKEAVFICRISSARYNSTRSYSVFHLQKLCIVPGTFLVPLWQRSQASRAEKLSLVVSTYHFCLSASVFFQLFNDVRLCGHLEKKHHTQRVFFFSERRLFCAAALNAFLIQNLWTFQKGVGVVTAAPLATY